VSYKIKNIPAMLILGFVNGRDIRLTGISDEAIGFEVENIIEGDLSLTIAIFNFKNYCYDEFHFDKCKIVDCTGKTVSYIYKIEPEYLNTNQRKEFLERLGEIDNTVSIIKEVEGTARKMSFLDGYQPFYPLEKDKEFCKSYKEQEEEEEWHTYQTTDETNNGFLKSMSEVELAFSINNFSLYEKFSNTDFKTAIQNVLEQNQLKDHPIFVKPFSRVYIGNEFCPNIFLETDKLIKLLDQTRMEGLNATIALSFLREDIIELRIALLKRLVEWCDKNDTSLEVIVNDWGMMELVAQTNGRLKPILGRLLNKRKKDPKYKWKWGIKNYTQDMEENFLNGNETFISLLSSRGVNRFEFESHIHNNLIPEGKHSLHFPYYQTNTSQYCTLYADCTGYSRTKQKLVSHCPRYCTEFSFQSI